MKGWQESASVTVEQMFRIIEDIPKARVMKTNVDVEGQKKGVDEKQARDFISSCPHSVIASGGVTGHRDAEILRDAGAVAAVVGLALYTFEIRPWEWEIPWRV